MCASVHRTSWNDCHAWASGGFVVVGFFFNQDPSFLKYLIVAYPCRMLHYQFLEFLKVKYETVPSAIRLLCYGTSFQFGFGKQTSFILLRLHLKLSFSVKLRLHHEPFFSYAAALACCGEYLVFTCLFSLPVCLYIKYYIRIETWGSNSHMHRENMYNHAERPKITLLITAPSLHQRFSTTHLFSVLTCETVKVNFTMGRPCKLHRWWGWTQDVLHVKKQC